MHRMGAVGEGGAAADYPFNSWPSEAFQQLDGEERNVFVSGKSSVSNIYWSDSGDNDGTNLNKSPLVGAEVLINIRGYWTWEAAVKLMEGTQIKLGLGVAEGAGGQEGWQEGDVHWGT